MAAEYRELSIRELRSLFPKTVVCDDLSEDLFVAELDYRSEMDVIKYPCRFDGFLAFLCYQGRFNVDINLHTYSVEEGSLLIYIPGNIVRVSKIDPGVKETVRFAVVAVSRDLMSSTRVDFNRLYEESLHAMENPCVKLEAPEQDLFRKYLDLISDISVRPLPNIREAVVSLISSTFYLAGSLWMDRVSAAQRLGATKSTHARAVLEDFIALVREHHTRERGLAFYAERLYLTPKYLSKLIKGLSGRSAHEWIDSFVILEAKNLLKYSDLTIKQIVFQLNFPNQTTFYRFFKTQTGMTPTEYRRS